MGRPKKPDPEKYCQACGKRLHRKKYPTTIEDMTAFKKRKYCNQNCMAKGMMKGNVKIAGIRSRARKLKGKKCQNCGTIKNLQVHHKDLNPWNNDPSNLQTLCATCHMKWHWGHDKNRRKKTKNFNCKICGKPARKLDMCQLHYQRYRKYGNPLMTKKKIGSHYELVKEMRGIRNGRELQDFLRELKAE